MSFTIGGYPTQGDLLQDYCDLMVAQYQYRYEKDIIGRAQLIVDGLSTETPSVEMLRVLLESIGSIEELIEF